MKTNILIIINIIISSSLYSTTSEINEIFIKYKSAIINKNGNIAINIIDKNTINMCSNYLWSAIYADKNQLDKMLMIDRIFCLYLRISIPKEILTNLNQRTVFMYAVSNDIIRKNSVIRFSPAEIKMNGNYASMKLLLDNEKSPHYYLFQKEDNMWKINLYEHLKQIDSFLISQSKALDVSENKIVIDIVKSLVTNKIDERIWNPILIR